MPLSWWKFDNLEQKKFKENTKYIIQLIVEVRLTLID